VDIIAAGGSNTLLADDDDRLRVDDTRVGEYPLLRASATGEPVAVVNTDGNYRYVGRLVAGFDGAGILSEIREESGAYATDDAGVAALGNPEPIPGVVAATDEVRSVITELDSDIFGATTVFLNGQRESVRTEETNLGNLTADANLAVARSIDPTVAVSLKNGGGIRASIGAFAPDGTPIPPPANPLTGKEEGQVSLLDVQNALRFDNSLSILTLTAAQLKDVLEHGVAATEAGATPGQFPQVGGISFSFDPSLPGSTYDEDGARVSAGERVRSAAILNDDGGVVDVLVENGQLVGDSARPIRVVTLGFLADGGDGYPFPADAEREDIEPAEQAALGEYLGEIGTFGEADVPASEDVRIQNLSMRDDAVLSEAVK
jgi:2',3'-cyclic-nucleotide 2'-phosphodiesterase (5'-nucleotidase family)